MTGGGGRQKGSQARTGPENCLPRGEKSATWLSKAYLERKYHGTRVNHLDRAQTLDFSGLHRQCSEYRCVAIVDIAVSMNAMSWICRFKASWPGRAGQVGVLPVRWSIFPKDHFCQHTRTADPRGTSLAKSVLRPFSWGLNPCVIRTLSAAIRYRQDLHNDT